ncbi:hypothetical protein [Actinoplanes flavus]|uniref:DUF559 domain-containing protein n=1 Tax=Actinoplanes flavus TaxID=2820290 RepID=A0ABS3UBU6_9ACTN|nr:hypothetical protein [Actinoplanes flavus]MBO3736255.1 hypothetical protein [Actinoplanes flavus]
MSAETDPPLRELLARQAGVLSRSQALRHLSARMVERRLSSRRWQAAHRGIYVAHTGPIGRDARRWIAVLSTGEDTLLGGLSALETVGFRGFLTDRIDVLVRAGKTPSGPPNGVVVHRTGILPGSDIHLMGGPPGTMPARSLVDAAQWAISDQRAWAIIAAGFQQRLVCADDVRTVLTRMSRAKRRSLISEAVTWSSGGVHSTAEADFLRLCRQAGLPEPRLQHARRGAHGRRNYLDAYFEESRVHVEIDGGQHMDVEHWWADMRRQNELWIPGDRLLRFPAWAVRHRPAEITAQLRAALRPIPFLNASPPSPGSKSLKIRKASVSTTRRTSPHQILDDSPPTAVVRRPRSTAEGVSRTLAERPAAPPQQQHSPTLAAACRSWTFAHRVRWQSAQDSRRNEKHRTCPPNPIGS